MGFPGVKRLGVNESLTSTTKEHELGALITTSTGDVYQYVLAGEAIAAYSPVDFTVAYTASVVDAGDVIMGVAQVAIASGSYGWVLIKGVGTMLVTADLVASRISNVSVAGAVASVSIVDDADAGNGLYAITYATEAATPAGVSCRIL